MKSKRRFPFARVVLAGAAAWTALGIPLASASEDAAPLAAQAPSPKIVRRIFAEIPVLSLDTMTRQASEIVFGRTVAVHEVQPEQGWSYIEYEVEVFSSLKRSEARTIPVRVVGGEGLELVGAPRLEIGHDAVLFLHESAGTFGLLGLGQGVYTVRQERSEPATVLGTHALEEEQLGAFLQRVEHILYQASGEEVR